MLASPIFEAAMPFFAIISTMFSRWIADVFILRYVSSFMPLCYVFLQLIMPLFRQPLLFTP